MMYKYALVILIIPVLVMAQENDLTTLNPDNTIIALDFHGVLVDTDYGKMYQLVDRNFAKTFAYALPKVILQAPWWIYSILGLLKNYPKSAIFSQLAQQYTFFKPLVPTITRMTNQQTLKPGMSALLDLLNKAKYPLALASNISEETVVDLNQNGPQEVNALLNRFFPIENRLIPTPQNGMLHKPNAAYFETLQAMFPGKTIVFFDDKKVNRDQALEHKILAFDPAQIYAVTSKLLQNASAASIESV